ARDELRPGHPLRRLRPLARPSDLLRGDAPRLGALLDGGGRLLVRASPPLGRAPAERQAAQAPAQRVRAAAHPLQRPARRARGHRAPPPYGRRSRDVRDGLPAHRVRLAEHAAVRGAALRRGARGRSVQDQRRQHAALLPPARHTGGPEGPGARRVRVPRFGLNRFDAGSVDHFAADVRRAEELGWDAALQPDSQLRRRDTYVLLAAAARVTERITLGTLLANPMNRHATV